MIADSDFISSKREAGRHELMTKGVQMLSFLLLCLIGASSIWVFWDASGNRIGDISDHVVGFRYSAVAWALATLFLWPIAFPYYLRLRTRMIHLAREHPVETPRKQVLGVVLLALGFMGISVAFPLFG